jgi:hypothetical protein
MSTLLSFTYALIFSKLMNCHEIVLLDIELLCLHVKRLS